MTAEAVPGHLFPAGAGLSVVAVGVDGKAAPGQEPAPYFDVLGLHELNQILHDDVDDILVEIAVVPEGKQVEL